MRKDTIIFNALLVLTTNSFAIPWSLPENVGYIVSLLNVHQIALSPPAPESTYTPQIVDEGSEDRGKGGRSKHEKHNTRRHGEKKICGLQHKKKHCDDKDDCCSANGFCGKSESFCGNHCQRGFGSCWNMSKISAEPALGSRQNSTSRRCGEEFGNCPSARECCSSEGHCGLGSAYCSVPDNCQPEFGSCDSDKSPNGRDLRPEFQPRPRRGSVFYKRPIKHCTAPGTLALTYDDGPSNNTDKILDLLQEQDAKATFFLTGNNNGKGMIDKTDVWVNVTKRIIMEGHQIGSHGWSHLSLDKFSQGARLLDMTYNDRAIANIIGKFPTYMRPPYLQCSKNCLEDMTDLGYHVIEWDVNSQDPAIESPSLEEMKTHMDLTMDSMDPHDNMLLALHDHNQHVVELTKHVLELARPKMWEAVTIGQCLQDPAEYWYQELAWVEPFNTSSNGCVVSGPNYCVDITSFDSTAGCKKSLDDCREATSNCIEDMTPMSICDSGHALCGYLEKFCTRCERYSVAVCKTDDLRFTTGLSKNDEEFGQYAGVDVNNTDPVKHGDE